MKNQYRGFGTFDSMNPYSRKGRAASLSSAPFESLLVETGDEIGSSYGLLAESIEYPADQKWVIFQLRKEAKFSDGTPVTADDVAFTYNLFLEQGLPSYRAVLAEIVQGVEVIDPYTIKYTFSDQASKETRYQSLVVYRLNHKLGLKEARLGLTSLEWSQQSDQVLYPR